VITSTANSSQTPAIAQKSLHVNKVKNVAFDGFNNIGTISGSTCSQIYCHSTGTSVATGASPVASVNWSGTLNCSGCHGGTGNNGWPTYTSGAPKANSHVKHGGYDCTYCHSATLSAPTTIGTPANHVNKAYDVGQKLGINTFSYWFTTNGGQCSNISCHGVGSQAKWGATLLCADCHSALSAAHAKHTSLTGASYGDTTGWTSGGSYRFGCGNCHPVATSSHANSSVEISLNPADGGQWKSLNAPTAGRTGTGGNTVCNLTYCHSDGSKTSVNIVAGSSPQWSSTPYSGDSCSMCHGNSPSTGSHPNHVMAGIHYDDIYTGTTGLRPAGAWGSIASWSTLVRPHGNAATATTINCNICHSATVTAANNRLNSQCSSCHTSGAGAGNAVMVIGASSTQHLDGTIDVSIQAGAVRSKAQIRSDSGGNAPAGWTRNSGYKASGSYDSSTIAAGDWAAGSKTCTTACHLGQQSPAWGAAASCVSCHRTLP